MSLDTQFHISGSVCGYDGEVEQDYEVNMPNRLIIFLS